MIQHIEISNSELYGKIRQREIRWAGNRKLKIYGTLNCGSGKRMKKENRVFFYSLDEAKLYGFRPCGHCMRT
ncbi:Ada metal-binding domain-containing protein [Roseivirga echinicomitans]|uniref:Metal-binding protein n=1 Tax=Roseivirga echinicomitans TaxID=296218 RepID=A0A150XY68_9BACT|nr:Ada metal-binding domain-containing protein [Roseivirga echinicomitans]KYG83545.1 metal-binding protein [Roseivirga echinicomitans]